jgi:cysteine synthase/cystathionine beta-lyase/cystathionine gamma-synthase
MVLELSPSSSANQFTDATASIHSALTSSLGAVDATSAKRLLARKQLSDLRDDLAELDYLIDHVRRIISVAYCEGRLDSFPPTLLRTVERINKEQKKRRDDFESVTNGSPAAALGILSDLRTDYLNAKANIRDIYRQCGSVVCMGDWQSPIYASSVPMNANRLSDAIAEHKWDYKRDGHFEAVAYEKQFLEQHVDHLGFPGKSIGYLTNCGMAAFTTVLHWLAHEIRLEGPVLALEPMYFENLHLANGFFPHLTRLNTQNSEQVLQCLRGEQPSIVLLDAITNCNDVLAHDMETVLNWAKETTEPLAIVIDTTCLPTALLPKDLFAGLPPHVMVILVESLAKHHQFGMDTVTGGIVVLCAEESLQASFHKTRARLGTNISDATVGCLPLPSGMQLVNRMKRHSRNLQMLVRKLESYISETPGVIESISWLNEGSSLAPEFNGTCFSIHLHESLKSIDKYREFEETVLELASEKNLPVALSTSFGFDVTRLYVTAPSTPFEPAFLRVSIGTETAAEVDLLADILCETHYELGRKWHIKPIATRIDNRDSQASVVSFVENRHRENPPALFAGEDALKQYLSPANYTPTPLVELPNDLNPLRADGVRIFAKMMPLVPLMNIKSIPAFSMLQKAAERGELQDVSSIIESSSGNTVLSLSVMAKLFGIDDTYAIVDHSIAPSLERMLRLFGIQILKHPGPGHELYSQVQPRSDRAKKLGEQAGWLNPGQYANPDNPEGFAQWLAPDLWTQTQGRLSVLSCGLGTCGTMVGVSNALRKRNPDLEVVACCPLPGEAIPGPREYSQLVDVAFPWNEVANARFEMPAEEAFSASIKLLRRGIFGGPSSGMNYAGVMRYLEEQKKTGRLADMIAPNGELWCAFLCCDSPLPHVDEYYDALGEEYFAAVHDYDHEASQSVL